MSKANGGNQPERVWLSELRGKGDSQFAGEQKRQEKRKVYQETVYLQVGEALGTERAPQEEPWVGWSKEWSGAEGMRPWRVPKIYHVSRWEPRRSLGNVGPGTSPSLHYSMINSFLVY